MSVDFNVNLESLMFYANVRFGRKAGWPSQNFKNRAIFRKKAAKKAAKFFKKAAKKEALKINKKAVVIFYGIYFSPDMAYINKS